MQLSAVGHIAEVPDGASHYTGRVRERPHAHFADSLGVGDHEPYLEVVDRLIGKCRGKRGLKYRSVLGDNR